MEFLHYSYHLLHIITHMYVLPVMSSTQISWF